MGSRRRQPDGLKFGAGPACIYCPLCFAHGYPRYPLAGIDNSLGYIRREHIDPYVAGML